MAFKSISDTAWPLTDDGPLASVGSVRMAGNAAAVSDERPPAVGIVYPAAEPFRACSFFEGAIGPYFIWIPSHEDWEKLRVRVRIDTVELSGGTGTEDAAYITATMGTSGATGDPYLQRPPIASADWIKLQRGDSTATLSGGIDATTIEIPLEGARGWVAVFVWIKSLTLDDEVESSDLFYIQPRNGSIGINELSSATKSAMLDPPEWMVEIEPKRDPGDQSSEEFAADPYQVCYHRGPALSPDWLYLMPPPDQDYATQQVIDMGSSATQTIHPASVTIYALGVVPILSIAIDAVPMTFEPRAEAFYSKRPAAEQWKQLAEGANLMVHQRTRQWACWPGPDSYNPGNHSRPWPLRADSEFGFTGGAALDTTWRTLIAADIGEEPPDDTGYEGIVSVALNKKTDAFHPNIVFRLVVLTGASAAPSVLATGEEYTQDQIRVIAADRWSSYEATPHRPIHHTLSGSWQNDEWQTRGIMYWGNMRSADGRHDWERVLTRTLPTVEVDGLTYPVKVAIQAKLDAPSDPDAISCLVVGGAIRSADID